MRKLFFWMHLILGTCAGLVILVMSVSGVLLMYERQMVEWADRGFRSVPKEARMSPEELLKTISEQVGSNPESLTLRSAADAPAEVSFGPRVVYAMRTRGRCSEMGRPAFAAFSVPSLTHTAGLH
jgi:uncharacterized iron-regulated membrane protein